MGLFYATTTHRHQYTQYHYILCLALRNTTYGVDKINQPLHIGAMAENARAKSGKTTTERPKRQIHPNSLANLRKEVPRVGRPKGELSKVNRTLKTAIIELVNTNGYRLQQWLDEIYEQEGPVKAWQCFEGVFEYSMPKLARVEHTGQDGGPVQVVQVSFQGVQQAKIEPKPNQVETLSPLDVPILSQLDRVETSLIETTVKEYSNPSDSNTGGP